MTPITSSAASDTDSARNRTDGSSSRNASSTNASAAAGQVHVEQHDVGHGRPYDGDRGGRVVGLADDLDPLAQLGLHAGAEQPVVVHEDDPRQPVMTPCPTAR